MKKGFILFLLSAIFVLTGIFAVGCGKSINATQAYNEINNFVMDITSDQSPFSNSTVNGVETSFYLENFKTKNDSNEFVDDDQNYLLLNAISLNYIYKYYSKLESIDKKYDCSTLYESSKVLQTKYQEMKGYSDRLDDLSDNAESFVYKGYFSDYKAKLKEFIEQSYSTAYALGDFLINNVQITSKLGREGGGIGDLEAYLDYEYVIVFKDFSDFFMGSCQGRIIDNAMYNDIKSKMTSFCSEIINAQNKGYYQINSNNLITMTDAFNGERRMFSIAINGFSLYDFTTKYENSFEAYEKTENSASAYYGEIQRYILNENNIFTIYTDYLRSKVKN